MKINISVDMPRGWFSINPFNQLPKHAGQRTSDWIRFLLYHTEQKTGADRLHIFPKHFSPPALPPFWMTDKGDKWEYTALLERWKSTTEAWAKRCRYTQEVPLPAAATTGTKETATEPACLSIKFEEGKKEGKLARVSHRAGRFAL